MPRPRPPGGGPCIVDLGGLFPAAAGPSSPARLQRASCDRFSSPKRGAARGETHLSCHLVFAVDLSSPEEGEGERACSEPSGRRLESMPPKVAVGAAKPSGATAKPAGGAAAKQAGAGSATAKRPAATKAAGAGLGALAKGTVRLPLRLAANHMRPCQSAGSATRSVTEREISHSKWTTRVKRVRAAPMRNMCESHRVSAPRSSSKRAFF